MSMPSQTISERVSILENNIGHLAEKIEAKAEKIIVDGLIADVALIKGDHRKIAWMIITAVLGTFMTYVLSKWKF